MTRSELINHLDNAGIKDEDEVKMLLIDEADRKRPPLELDIYHAMDKTLFVIF